MAVWCCSRCTPRTIPPASDIFNSEHAARDPPRRSRRGLFGDSAIAPRLHRPKLLWRLVLHMLVSLKRLLIDRDAVLQRTWFWRLSSPGNCVKKSHEFKSKETLIINFSSSRSVLTLDAFPMPAFRFQRRKLKSATKKVLDVWMPAIGCFRRVP